jgi:dolichyl-diphosphooligosaccharide--protein glycosyltransferase
VWGEFSPVVLSNFQPMWFAACAAGFALLSSLWARNIASETAIDRSLAALALAGAGLGVALLVLPELSAGVLQSWDWFSKDEAFQASVAESAPLFRAPARRVQELFSRLVYVTPLAIGLLVWEKGRSARPAFWFLLCWASVLFVATLTQRRFMNSASVVYSLTMALALTVAFQRIALLGRQTPLLRAAATVAFAAVLGWSLLPVFTSYGLDLVNLQRSVRGETLQLARIKRVLLLKTAAAYWLRRVSPSTSGYFDQSVEPEYSVLTPWSDGHVFRYRARRPVNQDNFGNDVGSENFELAERYYSLPNEAEAVAILEQMGARYVVASAIEVRRVGGYGLRSMFARLSLPEGGPKRELGRGDEARRLAVTRLVHHRLIYETAPFEGAPGDGRSYYKLYELVPGARVSGSAPAGTLLEARLSLFPALGGELLFVTAAQTDASGRYSLTVPYPNARFSEGVRSGEFYSLNSPAGSAQFTVSERAVRSGEAVEGPSLAQ